GEALSGHLPVIPATPEPEAASRAADALFPQLSRRSPLLELGEAESAGGNRPFLLDDPGVVWLVESGRVEIFTVGVEEGRPVGARHRYLPVDPGEGFFGMDLERYDLPAGFLAVGRTGTVLRRVPVSALRRAATNPRRAAEIATVVDRWVTALSRGLTAEIL